MYVLAKSGPPEFVETLSNFAVIAGEEAHLECQLGGSPASKVEWFKNNKPLMESNGVKFRLKDDVCALHIASVTSDDGGVYQCVATNDSGAATTTAELSVVKPDSNLEIGLESIVAKNKIGILENEREMPPIFTEEAQDGSVTVLDGGNVRLEARIGGVPTPVVEWFKDETPVDTGEHYVKIVDGDRHCLDIIHVSPDDSGTYKCIGSNHLGTVTRVYSLDIEGRLILFILVVAQYHLKYIIIMSNAGLVLCFKIN